VFGNDCDHLQKNGFSFASYHKKKAFSIIPSRKNRLLIATVYKVQESEEQLNRWMGGIILQQNEQQGQSFQEQQMNLKNMEAFQNQPQMEQQFQQQKQQALQAMQQAGQTIRQDVKNANLQSLQQIQQQLQQASKQINHMQGLAAQHSTAAQQQQLEQVYQQIQQASRTLQLIESLNSGNNSFQKG
jgi:tRNA nucleotidyltransferase/poly(A) polymerase